MCGLGTHLSAAHPKVGTHNEALLPFKYGTLLHCSLIVAREVSNRWFISDSWLVRAGSVPGIPCFPDHHRSSILFLVWTRDPVADDLENGAGVVQSLGQDERMMEMDDLSGSVILMPMQENLERDCD
jgi:hypothetical protein